MNIIPSLSRRPFQYIEGVLPDSGQPIIQIKDPGIDWARYKAWQNALYEPYEQWVLRTQAKNPEKREWL